MITLENDKRYLVDCSWIIYEALDDGYGYDGGYGRDHGGHYGGGHGRDHGGHYGGGYDGHDDELLEREDAVET